jgi:hypothetical protein
MGASLSLLASRDLGICGLELAECMVRRLTAREKSVGMKKVCVNVSGL